MLWLVAVALASEPRFVVPDGWTDLSPGKPLDGLDEDDKMRAEAAAKAHYLLYAVDKQTDDDLADNVNALRQPSRTWSDTASVEAEQAELEANSHGKVTVTASEVRRIDGVDCVRFEATLRPESGGVARQVYYLMPLGDDSAVVVYTTGKDTWEAMKPVFDATAAKTNGLAPPTPSRWGTIILLSLIGGVLGGGLLGGAAWFLKRRQAEG
jgi:hypothetical protein